MRRFAKDRKYIREDYKASRELQQFHNINSLDIKVKVSTSQTSHKMPSRDIPRNIKKSILMTKSLVASQDSKMSATNMKFKGFLGKIKQSYDYSKYSFYKEFLQLQKQSKNYIQYYNRKHNQKLMDLVQNETKRKQKHMILIILKEKIPEIFQQSFAEKKLLALGINPDDDFDPITWSQFSLMRKLMTQKNIGINQSINFLVKFFVPNKQNQIKRQDFITLISSILRPFSSKQSAFSNQTLLGSVLKRMQKQQFLQGQYINPKQLRSMFSKEYLFSCNDFLYLLFSKQK